MKPIGNSWDAALAGEFAADYYRALTDFVDAERARGEVYPPEEMVFAALALTPLEKVKAVIIGQDPYHEPGQAQGLAFYVPPSVKPPPSLRNIARELGMPKGSVPDLHSWAEQGVLLLNATLTVAAHRANSHQGHGWERFTDAVIRALNERSEGVVYLLWGAYAQKKAAAIDRSRNLVLEAAHPSPLSAAHGFFGCDHFRKCNEYLLARGGSPIAWR